MSKITIMLVDGDIEGQVSVVVSGDDLKEESTPAQIVAFRALKFIKDHCSNNPTNNDSAAKGE